MAIQRRISEEQAAFILGEFWPSYRSKGCGEYRYEPPNGVGLTGGFGALWGYRRKECIFFCGMINPRRAMHAGLV